MNFISGNAAIKDIPFFISDIFLGDNELFKSVLSGDREDDHLLNQLISDCLPDLMERKEAKREKQIYSNLLPVVTDLFQSDLDFLLSDKQYFLENFELFFKYYYFFYFTQLAIKLDDFGAISFKLKPVYFTMEWENLSESRISLHKNGWKHIHKNYERIFAHANALELLNYITVEGTSPGDYEGINLMYNTFSQDEKITFGECLDVLMTFYKEKVNTLNPDASWQSCEEQLQESLIGKDYKEYFTKKMYSFWYLIKYQFENGKRKKPYTDYAQWLITFTKENFTKSAGRYGTKMVLSQEMLLFLTKLCVGKKDKIRLKTFWEELSRRGVAMDETSKSEVVKLFERINLIEKKSDSGDAQYIKSSI
nr:DNA phosphorothioation-dependent restriction protein DptG [Flavobacterium coralii]